VWSWLPFGGSLFDSGDELPGVVGGCGAVGGEGGVGVGEEAVSQRVPRRRTAGHLAHS
jgi:hypothetical protein